MLSLAAMGSQSLKYYTELAREDYYLKGGEPPGTWFGRGAADLGLSGTLDKQVFKNLFLGYAPDGKERLAQNAGKIREGGRPGHHPGWDLTFSAPKSVSTLWALSNQKTRSAIERCQREAAQEALEYLEQTAAITKRGRGGAIREEAQGLVVAIFPHGTSRAQDPQLHTHCLVMNLARRGDQSWGTVLGQPLFQAKMTAGALYRASLSAKLEQELGLSVHRTKDTFELSSVPKSLMDLFSTRRKQILAELDARGEKGARAAARATKRTRVTKEHLPRQALFERWRWDAAAHDLSIQQIEPHPPRDSARELRQAMAAAITTIGNDQSYFSDRQLLRRLAEEGQGRGLSAPVLRKALEDYLAKARNIVPLGRVGTERYFATKDLFETEQTMIASVQASKESKGHTVSPKDLLASINLIQKKRGHELSEEQHLATAHITLHPGSIKAVQGSAGTGKTVMLEAARLAWEKEGYRVYGACIAGKAARTLQAESGIPSDTIAKRLIDLGPLRVWWKKFASLKQRAAYIKAARKNRFKMDSKTILVIDEAGMVDTPQMARLIEETKRAGAKLVLVGDKDQLPPIGPGGAFPRIMEELGAAKLTDIRRQKEEWAREAAKLTASGQTRKVLAEYASRGLLCLEPTRQEAMLHLVSDWARETAGQPEKALILAGTRADAADLNRLAQETRRQAGALGDKSVSVKGTNLIEGDRVLLTKRSRALELENGDTGTLLATHSRSKQVYVQLDRGPKVFIDLRHYQDIELGYAATTHKAQGQTTERAYVLLGGPMQSRSLSYVQLSRARLQTRLYADRAEASDSRVLAQLRGIGAVADQMAIEHPKELASDIAKRAEPQPTMSKNTPKTHIRKPREIEPEQELER